MDKVLILGGKPIGSCEIVKKAKEMGLYTIVADYLKMDESAAKKIADEHWEISTSEVNELKEKCLEENVIAVLTGVHEFNIERKIELCDVLKLPQYCSKEQWDFCENKYEFKKMCEKHGLDVAKTYTLESITEKDYPVIVKPVDSSGSRGFSICNNYDELQKGVELALKFSVSKRYLIEEYVRCDACIVHYTAINGEIIFSGISDKYSERLQGGSSVMALQVFPSNSKERYIKNVDEKAKKMFEDIGVKNGPIWIEVFNDEKNNRFIFNEMGYRFGGSMTNYPVQFFYGIDQIDLMILNSLGKDETLKNITHTPKRKHYCIFPMHVKAGTIKNICGIDELKKLDNFEQIVFVHYEGDKIENWGSAQNVFAYLHISYDDNEELTNIIDKIKGLLSVKSDNDEEMLYTIFDFNRLIK